MIELPEIFKNDTQGNTTHLVPLIIINNRLYLSTQKTKLDGKVYSPFLKKLGNISEGANINDRKYKVSNSRITFYNYTYNNEKLIDVIMQEETFNTPIEIYYKSQNAKSLDDCLRVYSGYIKNIKERKDDINIESEDKTEQVLGKEIPQRFTPTEGLPEKHRNIAYPIVYGLVDKAHLIFDIAEDDSGVFKLVSDNKPIGSIGSLYIFDNDTYVKIMEDATLLADQVEGTIYKNLTLKQFERTEGSQYITVQKHIELGGEYESDTIISSDGHTGSPIAFNMVEVEGWSPLEHTASKYKQYWRLEDGVDRVAITNILSFSNEEGTIPSKDVAEGVYLMPKVFSDETSEMGLQEWGFGQCKYANLDYYQNLFGESQFNFQAKPFISDSSIVKSILMDDLEEKKDLYNELSHPFGYQICKAYTLTTEGQKYDDLFIELEEGSQLAFDVNYSAAIAGQTEVNTTYEIQRLHVQGTNILPIQTKNITNNNITIGQREFSNGNFILGGGISEHGGVWEWLYIRGMNVKRRCVMSDFTSRDLYAYVVGRLDNEGLRYTTSLTTLTTEGRAVRPTRDIPSTPTAPTRVTKPTRTKRAIKKQAKTTSKGSY